jgi:DNA adenine methylase
VDIKSKGCYLLNLPKLLFRWAGGKFYALKKLRPYWQCIFHDEYREPLVGGGSVFFDKPKVQFNWLNDKHHELMITYQIIANPHIRKQFIDFFENEVATKKRHSEIIEFEPKNELEIAFKFFYLNRTSFSGKMKKPYWGYRPVRSLPPSRWKERIEPCGRKLEGVTITCLDYQEVIEAAPKGKQTLLFVDPPYYHTQNQGHYAINFSEEDHLRLARLLKKTDHKFFLTYDDCKEVRALYHFARNYPLRFVYRIDDSRYRDGRRKYGKELVITNYDVSAVLEKSTPQSEILAQSSLKSKSTSYEDQSIRSPFRFPGSKAQAIKFIKPHWDFNIHQEYREPFLGGGAVFFSKPKAEKNWLNDIDDELIITYQIIQNIDLYPKLIQLLSTEVASKERHTEMREWKPKTKLDIAYRYFYLNRTSYSGIMKLPAWGFHETKSVPPEKWGARIEQAHQKLQGVKLTSLDFHSVIKAPPEMEKVFMYIDPPYYMTDQKRAYTHSFTIKDHRRLAKVLKETSLPFCLTYDDCEPVRDLYHWAEIIPVSWRYHTANATRATRKMGQELIISNYLLRLTSNSIT